MIEVESGPRRCIVCSQLLSLARLAAQPCANECVPCLSEAGDVTRIRRYDEYSGTDQEVCTQTYFRDNAEMENYISHRRNVRIPKIIDSSDEDVPPESLAPYYPTLATESFLADVDVNLRGFNLMPKKRVFDMEEERQRKLFAVKPNHIRTARELAAWLRSAEEAA